MALYLVSMAIEAEADRGRLETELSNVVSNISGTLIPTGYAPDLDTFEETSDLEFGSTVLVDMNPAMV